MEKYILMYLICINAFAFIVYGIDKKKAIKGKWRISESTLIALALIGGSIGALAGMKIFHHKTRKKKFAIGVPAILIIQIAAGCMILAGCKM